MSLRYLMLRIPCQYITQGRFTRTIWSHQDMCFTFFYIKTHPMKNFLVFNPGCHLINL